jgi:hypothetical protein
LGLEPTFKGKCTDERCNDTVGRFIDYPKNCTLIICCECGADFEIDDYNGKKNIKR